MVDIIAKDFKKTGSCSFAIAEEKFYNTQSCYFVLQKNSPFSQIFEKGYVFNLKSNKALKTNSLFFNGRSIFQNILCIYFSKLFSSSILKEAGMQSYWWDRESIKPYRCLAEARSRQKDESDPSIALRHLSGSFIAVAFGYGIAFLVFCLSFFFAKIITSQ